jgi:hypothetical protein
MLYGDKEERGRLVDKQMKEIAESFLKGDPDTFGVIGCSRHYNYFMQIKPFDDPMFMLSVYKKLAQLGVTPALYSFLEGLKHNAILWQHGRVNLNLPDEIREYELQTLVLQGSELAKEYLENFYHVPFDPEDMAPDIANLVAQGFFTKCEAVNHRIQELEGMRKRGSISAAIELENFYLKGFFGSEKRIELPAEFPLIERRQKLGELDSDKLIDVYMNEHPLNKDLTPMQRFDAILKGALVERNKEASMALASLYGSEEECDLKTKLGPEHFKKDRYLMLRKLAHQDDLHAISMLLDSELPILEKLPYVIQEIFVWPYPKKRIEKIILYLMQAKKKSHLKPLWQLIGELRYASYFITPIRKQFVS